MAAIFENACLTIAATKAAGHNEGLYSMEEGPLNFSEFTPSSGIRDEIIDMGQEPPTITKDLTGAEDHTNWPLLTRAWVFQERLLCPRILHFMNNWLIWECRAGILCDCLFPEKETDETKFRRAISSQSMKMVDLAPTQLRSIWYATVMRYSQVMGNLTYESDIFPALSGLANRISALLEDDYMAGLWRSNLVEGLLWTHEGKRRPSKAQPKLWRAKLVLGLHDRWGLV
ncbi:hypothetical protein EDB80DRAFT_807854 [Ilyonectria destructans]|nr:hypothetical protein EDB80DRAFT_807854 [Ilyonectria destructans]